MKKLLTISFLASTALMGAVPTTGDILRQVEPVKMPETPKALPSVGAGEYKAPLSAKDDLKTFVKSFKFSGNTTVSSEVLSTLVKPYEGKELGINGLKEVASIITKYYRDNGYFVARAYIPAQSMENGIVEIAIIEGTYGAFDMKNTSLVDTAEVQGYMDYLKGGELVSTMTLERQMLLINDLSGAQVTNAEVYPGAAVGTSDFRITVSPTPKYNGYAIADNYGLRYSGENRLSAGVNINSLSGIGDLLSFSGLISNTADLKNARIGYDRPLGYNGLKGGVSLSEIRYRLGEELSIMDAFGSSTHLNAYLRYPTVKTRTHMQTIGLDVDHRNIKQTQLGDEDHHTVNALTLKTTNEEETNLLSVYGNLYTSVEFTVGRVALENDIARTNDVLLNSEGGYSKAALTAIHRQNLVGNLMFQTSFRGQKSFGKNLDSTEDISVAGSNGVRAYEDSELSGDQGYVISGNFLYDLPQNDILIHRMSLFLDHARIWKNTTTFNSEDNIRNLNAVGIGYGANYNEFNFKATYAHGFGSESTPTTEAGISTNKNKFLIFGMMRF